LIRGDGYTEPLLAFRPSACSAGTKDSFTDYEIERV